jgi:hypothetical protein
MERRSPFAPTEKRVAVLAVLWKDKTVSEVCRERGISAQTFARWREQALGGWRWRWPTGRTVTAGMATLSVRSLRSSAPLDDWRLRTACWEEGKSSGLTDELSVGILLRFTPPRTDPLRHLRNR